MSMFGTMLVLDYFVPTIFPKKVEKIHVKRNNILKHFFSNTETLNSAKNSLQHPKILVVGPGEGLELKVFFDFFQTDLFLFLK